MRFGKKKHDQDMEQALAELETLLDELEDIATKAPVVSDSVYSRGKSKVIHSETGSIETLSAGGQNSA